MLSIFKKLFGGCCIHNWDTVKTETFNLYDGCVSRLPVGKKYVITLRCKHCGDVKMKKYEM